MGAGLGQSIGPQGNPAPCEQKWAASLGLVGLEEREARHTAPAPSPPLLFPKAPDVEVMPNSRWRN